MNKRDQEIDDLKSKVAFLRFWSPPKDDDAHHDSTSSALFFPDVTLVSFSSDDFPSLPLDPILAHKAILVLNFFFFFFLHVQNMDIRYF